MIDTKKILNEMCPEWYSIWFKSSKYVLYKWLEIVFSWETYKVFNKIISIRKEKQKDTMEIIYPDLID